MTTYTKLRDGSWGLRGKGQGWGGGESTTVTKRSGETKTECVGRVLWTGDDGTQLATIDRDHHSAPRPASRPSDRRGGIRDECERPSRHLTECADSNGAMGMCCPVCARQSRYERSFG